MKKLSIYILSCAFLISSLQVQAQSPINQTQYALDISQLFSGGTARFWGLGGAGISLGGDISSITTNPAGLGFYNQSQFSASGMLRLNSTDVRYLGGQNPDFSAYLNIPNIGIVFHNPARNSSFDNWKGGSFGLSINQQANFRSSAYYRGRLQPKENGFIDDFVEFALSPFLDENGDFLVFPTEQSAINYGTSDQINIYSRMAFETYLLDVFTDGNDNYVIDRHDLNTLNFTDQEENINTTGGVTNLAASYGGNFMDKLFIGAGIKISFIERNTNLEYAERPDGTDLTFFNLSERHRVSGVGFGLNLGIIYKPIPQINVGLNYKTPTVYQMSENIVYSMEANFINPTESFITDRPFEYNINYSFRSPQVVGAGLSYFLGKRGFVTADVEYMPLRSGRFDSSETSFQDQNNSIQNNLNDVINYRLGAEFRQGIYRARIGSALFGEPYNIENYKQERFMGNVGLGIRKSNYFVDLSVSAEHRRINPYLNFELDIPYQEQTYRLISGSMVNIVSMLSLGWNF